MARPPASPEEPIPGQTFMPETFGFSNAVRLSIREWVGVGLFTLALVLAAPMLAERTEKFDIGPNYRIPFKLSSDYWLYDRYSRLAPAHANVLVVGDSVIWGQYVTPEQTLSHFLNQQDGKNHYANLGLDGAHPAALAGLMEYYATGISGLDVLLHCNPLWKSSPRHDLQEDEDFNFNHPELVPQFFPQIPSYKVQVSTKIGRAIKRNVSFMGWTNHVQQAYFDQVSIPGWTMEHPYENPFHQLACGMPASDSSLRHEPISWTRRGIKQQRFDWVDAKSSFQWRSFQRTVDILEKKGNRVFVLVGPFNTHMIEESNLAAYHQLLDEIGNWLRQNHIRSFMPPVLPSDYYGDASHPLAPGYELLARQLREQKIFE